MEDFKTQSKYAAMYFHQILLPRVGYHKRYKVKTILRTGVSVYALVAAGALSHAVQSTETA